MSNTIETAITPAEAARRQTIIEDVRHSIALEGGSTTPEVMALQNSWAAGQITLDELGAEVRALYPTSAPR